MKFALCRLFFLAGILCLAWVCPVTAGTEPVWGTDAITLAPACAETVSLTNLLADAGSSVSLGRFYRAGGANLPVTPTECRVAHTANELLVTFRCTEKTMAYPAISHGVNWYSQLHSPAEQDAAFPDKVDLFISPDMNKPLYYQFAVTLDGQYFGTKRHALAPQAQSDEEQKTAGNFDKVSGFSAAVSQGTEEWTVLLRIPWKTIGGRPAARFGLIPVRTRWRQGEVTSPVAADFNDRPPVDLFIETGFSNTLAAPSASGCLRRLPSGTLRWRRPALLSYPDKATIREIWDMEQSLTRPTDASTFPQRVQLVQRWNDLLTLEGFNFRPVTGSIAPDDMSPWLVRRSVNAALRANETGKACQLLDAGLKKLDAVSRKWFADGSPGDILANEWKAITQLTGMEVQDRTLILHCAIKDRPMDLCLSLPQSGGVRIEANAEGYFKPADLLPLEIHPAPNGHFIAMTAGKIIITENPFAISFIDAAESPVLRIDPAQIAFRFDADGKVVATDFRNRLDPDEVIFGFGEKYDRLNQHGNVLTLWGVDDWFGLTAGIAGQSYKPVPVFHSSRGYSIFINSSYRLRADVGKTRPDQYRLTQQGPVFDDYFWIGPPERALASYTALTGKPLLPPKWAFEPWMGRTGRGWSDFGRRDPVVEQKRVIKQFAKLDIPHSAIYAEGSGADSPALNDFAAARGIHVLSWANSCISKKTQARFLPEISPFELPILNAGASPDVDYVDFSNTNAMELCRRWWAHRLHVGVAGSMVDFGDRTPEDAVFHDGQPGDAMHNFYSYDYHKTYSEVFREKRGDDFILFGRAAASGSQRWAAQFAGDHPANFFGLHQVLTGALNLSACGFSTWGSDLGGFLGWPDPAVYMRWTQFACFSPLMRNHGRTPREPWEYGKPALDNYKRCAWLHENLLNYIYNAAVLAHQDGIPIMRSMAVAYPQEPSLAGVNDQYMFGNDLLVAPIITEDNTRTISFPAGKWTDLWDGSVTTGPARVQFPAPLDTIPVFLKEGAAIPMRLGKNLQFGDSLSAGQVRALVISSPRKGKAISSDLAGGVTFRPSVSGYVLTGKTFSEIQFLLLYGTDITGVRLDGKVLQSWPDNQNTGRIAVRLPEESGSVREIEVELKTPRAAR